MREPGVMMRKGRVAFAQRGGRRQGQVGERVSLVKGSLSEERKVSGQMQIKAFARRNCLSPAEQPLFGNGVIQRSDSGEGENGGSKRFIYHSEQSYKSK